MFAFTILKVEKKLERKRSKKNDPRTLDIDIIDLNNKVFNFMYNNLIYSVPHKKLSNRNFVLYPIKRSFTSKMETPKKQTVY